MFRQMMVEDFDIEFEVTCSVGRQYLFTKEIVELWFAVCGESHYLPFISRKHVKSDEIRDGGIKLPKTMRQFDALQYLKLVAGSLTKKGSSFLPRAVPGKDRRPIEWRHEKRRCGVTL